MKKLRLIIYSILIAVIISCGIPTPDSVVKFNTPVILTGTKTDLGGGYYSYGNIIKSYSPNSITITIQAYQPEADFNGFNIYIRNSVDHPSKTLETAVSEHYYFNSSTGEYSNKSDIEATYIIPEGSRTSSLYPSISLNNLSSYGVYPDITSYPVSFTFTIEWDGQQKEITEGGLKKYYIGVTAVDTAGYNESSLSNVIQVYFDSGASGDPDF